MAGHTGNEYGVCKYVCLYQSVRPSFRPSVRPSVCLSVCHVSRLFKILPIRFAVIYFSVYCHKRKSFTLHTMVCYVLFWNV